MACVGVALAQPKPAAAPPEPVQQRQQLQQAERSRAANLAAQRAEAEKQRAARAEQKRLADERVKAAARLQQADEAVASASARLEELGDQRRQAEARLTRRAEAMAPLLPIIQRLSFFPSETLLAIPRPPEEALRGVLVLRGISKQLEAEAVLLRQEQEEVARLSREIEEAAPALKSAQARQREEADALDRQIVASRDVERAAGDAASLAARRAASDASRAENLRSVIAQIEAARREAEARAREEAERAEKAKHEEEAEAARRTRDALAAQAGPGLEAHAAATSAHIGTPVVGQVVRGFGENTEIGPSLGISVQAAPAARVISPCAGRVAYAGQFRTYGQLLIVDCGGGFHFVLAGMERLDVEAGHPVQPGEPVGVMPSYDPRAAGQRPALYVELRRQGQPVNPTQYLRARG